MIFVVAHRAVKNVRLPLHDVKRIVTRVCTGEKLRSARFSVVFVDDRSIRTIHKKYLDKDSVTDVITFSFESEAVDAEIFINTQQAKRQAKQFGVSVRNEIIRLIVHGVLHTVGYDDQTLSLQKKMFLVQEQYVAEFS